VAILAGSPALTTVADRLAGIDDALVAAGRPPGVWPVVEAAFTRHGGKEAARRVLAEHADVTAVVALNDDMAIGALSALRAAGVSVPADISVAGFDDIEVAEDLAPSLTTIRLPMRQMGELALELALSAPAARPRRRTTSHELVVRDSTAAPARRGNQPARG
jgi:LacI family transcriptional regulator